MITFDEAVPRIMAASTFQDLSAGETDLTKAYRRWVKLVHPDTVGAPRRETATQACAKLSDLYRSHRGGAFRRGDIADLFTSAGDVLLKVPRDPADNDLMRAEAGALRRLHTKGDPRFRAYAPKLIDSFVHEDDARRRRHVNVIKRQKDTETVRETRVTLETGLWIWRRLLVALGWAHRAGVVHGAVLEPHVLINRQDRGLVLVDWCYAGHRPGAIVKAEESAYPPEVVLDKTAGPATDIYMATGLMTRLIGEQMPRKLRNFAAGCTYQNERMRPQDAWALLAELDAIIPQRYRN